MKRFIILACGVMMAVCLFGCSLLDGDDDMELTPEEIESVSGNEPMVSSGGGVSAIETLQILSLIHI